jgi:hypothetical protein
MRWTPAELAAYYAKQHKEGLKPERSKACTKEADLHNAIVAHCNGQGWKILHHSRMDQPSTCPKGSPDFVIMLNGGKFAALECKTGSGKLSIEQLGAICHAERLNHTIFVVRSFTEFIEVTKKV